MKVEEGVWNFFQGHLGYSDDEMKAFMENPRNEEVLSKGAALMNKTIWTGVGPREVSDIVLNSFEFAD